MTTIIYNKTIALSALFYCILLMQRGSAVPINSSATTLEANSANEAEGITTDDATTTQPPRPRDMFDHYPETMKLKTMVGRTGLYRDLQRSKDLPTALWNTTADNLTEACNKYLRENHLTQTEGSCAASFFCDVQENFYKFPAVVIRAECEHSRCTNSYHTGVGVVDGSQGSCQPWHHISVTRIVFKPEVEGQRRSAQQSASTGEGSSVAGTQQKGKWEWTDELIPISCRCRAK